ncbi:B12-binding domain-containing radical SAM protein [bacterium]|nr:B12-binding domain-containing radical SAM protein [candidate division CSSED10-310 bacterium]
MRITLIRPRTGNTPDPPLGLMILAACLKPAGHAVQILDPGPGDPYVGEQIAAFGPDLVGFSLLTTQVSRAVEIHSQIREKVPDVVTAAGGIHPTALPEWTLRRFGFDFVVRGEGEVTFVEAAAALEQGRAIREIPGVAVMENGVLVKGPERELIRDLDSIPFPDREIVDFRRYLRPPGNIRGKFLRRATSLITSRGCPFGCIFCSSHSLFGREVRRRSISNIMQEIASLVERFRVDGLWFLDDTLLEDPDWLSELCSGLRSTGLPWGCQAHVRRADEGLFAMMRESGCLQLEFGVESGSPAVLRRLRKGSDPDDVRRAFAICHRLRLRTLANFMIGNPGESVADVEASLRLAREIRPDHVVVTFTTPLPGSGLYDEALREGWLPLEPDFSSSWIIRQTENPAVTCSLDAETMKRLRKKFDNAFFWTNIREYFRHPAFVLEITGHILLHPKRYIPGFARALRTGRMGHLVETVWEEYNRV